MYMTVASERSRRRLFDLGSITNAHFRTELGPTREAHFDQTARSERVCLSAAFRRRATDDRVLRGEYTFDAEAIRLRRRGDRIKHCRRAPFLLRRSGLGTKLPNEDVRVHAEYGTVNGPSADTRIRV